MHECINNRVSATRVLQASVIFHRLLTENALCGKCKQIFKYFKAKFYLFQAKKYSFLILPMDQTIFSREARFFAIKNF